MQELEMQPQQEIEIPYALAKLDESGRTIKLAISELPTLRKRLAKNKDDKAKAKEIYNDLQQQHSRLVILNSRELTPINHKKTLKSWIF